ncbi:MAG: hypothetical protein AB7J35_05610 [Dehalococcoidia bacterium]
MRIVLIIVAVLLVLGGGACAAPSLVTYRALDSDGFISGGGQMATGTAALIVHTSEFREVTEKEVEEGRTGGKVLLRIAAERADGGDVLVAVGSAEAVQALVTGGSYENVSNLEFGPFDYQGVALGGRRDIGTPDPQLFEVVASGAGRQEVTWTIAPGEWRAVIMNADGSAGVDVDVRFGARFPYLRGFAIAGMIIGGTIVVIGLLWLLFLFRPGRNRGAQPPGPQEADPTAADTA